MSSYAQLYVDGHALLAFRNEIEPTFLLLFLRDELREVVRTGADRPASGYDADSEYEAIEFHLDSASLRDRLDVLGITSTEVAATYEQLHSEHLEWMREFASEHAGLDPELSAREELVFEEWQGRVRAAFHAGETVWGWGKREVGSLRWLMELWKDVDPRLLLRAVVDVFPDSEVVLDVTDLAEGGWIDSDFDPRERALSYFGDILINGAPVIVLTRQDRELGSASQLHGLDPTDINDVVISDCYDCNLGLHQPTNQLFRADGAIAAIVVACGRVKMEVPDSPQ